MTKTTALLFITAAFCAPLTAQAQSAPDCSDIRSSIASSGIYNDDTTRAIATQGCTLSWVEGGTRRDLFWHFNGGDFTPPTLTVGHAGYSLASQSLPQLIDIDQDGLRDLVVVTSNGAPNADLDIYLYSAASQSYLRPVTLNGTGLFYDKSGLLIAPAKNGARQYIRFYAMTTGQIIPAFDVDPQDTCIVSTRGWQAPWTGDITNLPAPLRFDADLVDAACDIYQGVAMNDRTTPLREDNDISFIPQNTVF